MPTPLGDFHHPHALSDNKGFDEKFKKALKYCDEGLPPKQATEMAFNIILDKHIWSKWNRWAIEDMEAGFDDEDSNLIKLMLGLAAKDNNLHMLLSKRAIKVAEDGNPQMLQFLLKSRYGYTEKTRQEVDITSDDTPVTFQIVDMTPNEEDED